MLRAPLRLIALAVVVAGAIQLGDNLAGDDPPDEGSADVGFARAMRAHHAQGVEMAELLRDRTGDDDLRVVAADIALTQQAQIGQMRGWLDAWGLDPTSTEAPMAWADEDDGGGEDDGEDEDEMPGLASEAELDSLDRATGEQAEVLFLQLMIRHHEGGVHMALMAMGLTDEPEVQALARTIADGQQAEIRYLTALLTARSAEPLPSILPEDVAGVEEAAASDDRADDIRSFLVHWWLVGLGGVVLVLLARDLVRRPRPPSIAPGETPVATVTAASDEQRDRDDDRDDDADERRSADETDRFFVDTASALDARGHEPRVDEPSESDA